jgi:hypothetical protein
MVRGAVLLWCYTGVVLHCACCMATDTTGCSAAQMTRGCACSTCHLHATLQHSFAYASAAAESLLAPTPSLPAIPPSMLAICCGHAATRAASSPAAVHPAALHTAAHALLTAPAPLPRRLATSTELLSQIEGRITYAQQAAEAAEKQKAEVEVKAEETRRNLKVGHGSCCTSYCLS